MYNSRFLSTFAKLRKARISVVMSVHPSVCPHAKTLLSPDGFELKLTFEYLNKKKSQENSVFIKTWQE